MTDIYPEINLLEANKQEPIKSPKDAICLVNHVFHNKQNEYLIGIALDGDKKPLSARIMSIGSRCQSTLSIPDMMRSVISDGASGIIFIHNHPSGLAKHSEGDINACHDLENAASTLNLALVDFIVVNRDDYEAMPTKFNKANSTNPIANNYFLFVINAFEQLGSAMMPISLVTLSLMIFQIYIQISSGETLPLPTSTISALILLYPLSWGIKTVGSFLKLIF